MRFQGRITQWHDEKGYGFITPNGGGSRVFMHISSLAPNQRRPRGEELVHYEVTLDARLRPNAHGVHYVALAKRRGLPALGAIVAPGAAVVFFCFLLGAVLRDRLPIAVPLYYAVVSLVTYLAYRRDKEAAIKRRRRTAEKDLHFLELFGGWPGALIAQRWVRHKSQKATFQVEFYLATAVNLGLLTWLYAADGAKVVRALLGGG